MDNTQIRHSLCGNATGFYRISEVETLMELARADEREQIIKKIEFERDNVRGLQNDYTKILHILFDAVIKIMKYDIRGDYDK